MNFCISLLYDILLMYNFILIGGIILSWFPMLNRFALFRLVNKLSNLFMEPFHGYLILGPLDFTPIIGFMLYDGIVYAIGYLLTTL